MTTVLVTGGEGQLAHELKLNLPKGVDLITLPKSALDITQNEQVSAAFKQYQPDWVVNAAALTDVEACESNEQQVNLVNYEAVKVLLRHARNAKARVLQISTDYVFDGESSLPYTEADFTNPLNSYGLSKLKAEALMLESDELVVRTSWLFSSHHKNFMKTMLQLFESKNEVQVVEDQVGTPTSAASLARVIYALIDVEARGIFHWSGGVAMSWYDFACTILELAKEKGMGFSGVKVTPINSDELSLKATRPKWSVLSITKVCEFLSIEPHDWRQNLAQEIDRYKKENV